MTRKLASVVLALALVLALPALAGQGKGKGKGKPDEKGKSTEAGKPEDKGKDKDVDDLVRQGRAFGKDQERTIREWFSNDQNLEGLPPGLAKREELPPGLQRHLEKNGTLPPGLQKRIEPLPESLESKLPKTPEGIRRVVVAGNVILLEERTAKILDIVQGVIGGGSSEASSGVRRR